MNSGVEVTRIPASDDEISCSPAAISRNGPPIWMSPSTISVPPRPEKPRSAPPAPAIATRITAASAIRVHATIPGERSRRPILISM